MKPTFALNLSNERVGLLHRTGRGWLQVGEVAFDTPDLSDALAYLRRTALGLSPRGVSTKLVIPNSQILYCDVEAPGPDDEARRTQILAGLAGRTPYASADLVFDWRGKGTMVKVAVVARETLQEAEAFAVEHRFGPVSFVALPDPSQFKGEPFFGMTDAAKASLSKDETVEADRDAMTIVTRDLPLADMPPADNQLPAKRAERGEKYPAEPLADAVEKLKTASVATPATEPDPSIPAPFAPDEAAVQADKAPGTEAIPVADAKVEPHNDTATAPPAAPPGSSWTTDAPAPITEPVIDEAPFAEVEDTASVTDTRLPMAADDLPPAPSKAAQIAFASRRGPDDLRGALLGGMGGGKDKSYGDLPGAARADTGAKRPPPPLRSDAHVTAPSIPGSKKRKAVPTTPPPAVAAAAAALANSSSAMGRPTKPLTRPGGTFGAKPLPRRGKPRYLGLILTGLLLVALALIAAWSSYSLVRNEAETVAPETAIASVPATEVIPAINDEMLADQQDVGFSSEIGGTSDLAAAPAAAAKAAPADPTAQAIDAAPTVTGPATEPEAQAGLAATPLAAETVAPATPDPEVANVAIPATDPAAAVRAPAVEIALAPDLGLDAAAAGPEPRPADVAPDEIFLATADTPPRFQDALILPAPVLVADRSPAAAPPPPPFGTVYQFDANGLIRPTEEGILSPEGYMIFAGAPPVTPPPRSANLVAAAAVAAAPAGPAPATPGAAASLVAPATGPTTTDAAPADPAMAGFRPRPRPSTLVAPAAAQNDDDARLSDDQAIRVALLRPRPRPDAVSSSAASAPNDASQASLTAQANAAVEAALASAAETGNVMTLAVSRRPAARPKDMSRAVNAAVAAAVRAPDPTPDAEFASDNTANGALPEDDAEPELASAAPRIPTKTTVAKQATFANAINLSKINLIGVYGSPSKRYALVRLASGRYKKVSVGDTVDGGRVAAITASEVRYQKGGRLVSLKMPRT